MRQFQLIALALAFLAPVISPAQHFTGYHSSNLSGISGISVNPASIVGGRYLFDMNLISVDSRLSNNYIGLSTKLFSANSKINPIADSTYEGRFQDFRANFFKERDLIDANKTARIQQSIYAQGPSFAFQIGKNAFAITTAVREVAQVDNLEAKTADFILSELENPSLWNVDLDNKKFSALATTWSEFGIAYGREIWSNGEHTIKGALHLKFLLAMASAHFYADELMLNFKNDDTVRVRLSDIRFGYSNNLQDFNTGSEWGDFFSRDFFNKTTLGADVGFIYEWAPKHAQYRQPKDSSKYIKYKTKYTLKAGISANDIGYLRFDRGNWGANFDGVSFDWDLDTFAAPLEGIPSFGELMQDTFAMETNSDPYSVRLPTTLNFFVDYRIWKGFFVNFTGNIAFSERNTMPKNINAPMQLHALNQFTLTPRYEHTWFDVGIPISINGHNNFSVGTHLRVGPLVIGSLDCWNFIIGKNVRGLNVYMGLKVPIPHAKPKDKKEPKRLPDPKPDPVITVVDTVKVTIIDTVKVVVVDTVADPNPIVDFPEPDIFNTIKDTANLQNGSTPVTQAERDATKELLRIRKTYKYVPNIFEFEPFKMELAKGSVYFETGKYKVRSEDKPVLNEVAHILQNNPKLRIEIHGHADNTGDTQLNRELAAKRAEAVRAYLIEKGAPVAQIVKIDAFGSDRPIADNESEEGRQKNRRVELILASDGGF